MKRLLLVTITSALLGCGPAFAQATMGTGIPLGVTSPLGIGPGAPVGTTGIPLGATELATPGVSPTTGGSSLVGSSMTTTTCFGSAGQAASGTEMQTAGISGAMTGTATATGAATSAPTALFDGAGMSGGTASGTCSTGSAGLANSAASASSPGLASGSGVGRAGIPIGATELNTGGLSPLPSIIQQSPAPVVSTDTVPCPATEATVTAGTSMSGSC